ncbi:MAG: hypothetical protein JW807_03405 [Spirochaetes bacterium]|nr:hypothetical protein [Spirochaetota bacterium]
MAKSRGRPSRIWRNERGDPRVARPDTAGDERRKRVCRIVIGLTIAIILLLIPPCAIRHCRDAGDVDGFRVVDRAARTTVPAEEPAPVPQRAKKIAKPKPVPIKTDGDIKPQPVPGKTDTEAGPEQKSKPTEGKGADTGPVDSPFGKPKYHDFGTKIELDPPPVTR